MNIKTIAEYVENTKIKEILTEMGIDYGQGYGLSKPKPLQEYFEINKDAKIKLAGTSTNKKKSSNGC